MTNINKKVRCAGCVYARQDIGASHYSQKHCKTCERRETCEICRSCEYQDTCQARMNPKLSQNCERRCETLCSLQTLKWAAIECGNPDSEYYKALLNVTPGGEMQDRVTWSGCVDGERRCG
jgi:hypothetical protein